MNTTIIYTNGSVREVDATSDEVRGLIGADVICTVDLRDGRVMLIDDNGYQKSLPDNPAATALYHSVCKPGTEHRIVGDVAVVAVPVSDREA
jgi:hypothetical protein